MNNTLRKIIISSAATVLLSGCVIGLSSCSGKLEENSFKITQSFSNISIDTSDADIVISPSKDGLCRVVAQDKKNYRFSVSVVNDTLRIDEVDDRKWYQKIFNFKSRKLTVYVPEEYYTSLAVNNVTGDLIVGDGCKFKSIDVEFSTGDIACLASATENISIHGSTGDIKLKNLNAKAVSLKCTTGDISASGVICEEYFDAEFTTGDLDLTDVVCKSQRISGSTGDVSIKDLIASEKLDIRVTTGDVYFNDCDAAEVYIRCSTGDVEGSFLTNKIIFAETTTGDVDIPRCYDGGKCEIQTTTGDIEVRIKGK